MAEAAARSDDVTRALAAFIRERFQAPVVALRGLIEIVAEDAETAGLGRYADDFLRMRNAADRLLDLISSLLDGTETRPTSEALRHDLRTPVTSIIGYGELIAEDAREQGDAQLFAPLADLLEAAGRLLRELDQLVDFSGRSGGGQDGGDVLRQAAEVVRRLARHEPSYARGLTGRILVVDDNASIRDLVQRRLLREGHTVAVCGSGQAALDLAGRKPFDLMLLDLMMPGMNGLDVLERLRSRPDTSSLPVIIISALDEVEAAVRCIEAGADDYLPKPLNETLLRARIAHSLERKFLRDREQDALDRLLQEQERSEALLRNILPSSVVERLRGGETAIADQFDSISVLFCDLVGFTALSAKLSPAETLDLLNRIFSGFDTLAAENSLEKIKTIGDAYMAVAGTEGSSADHAVRAVRMACGMAGVVRGVATDDMPLDVRIGINTGPAVAGIIGRQKFFYDVWGDTVNVASRLETLAEPGRIHVSQETEALIRPHFQSESRGPMSVKGRGSLPTYYVIGEIGSREASS